jgi:ribosome-binding factor A
MPSRRQERTPGLIKKLAANFISRNIGLPETIITVNGVEIKSGLTDIKILISVWPENKEKEIMAQIKEVKQDFYQYMLKNFKIKHMPVFKFEIDAGEKSRRYIEEIFKNNPAS